MTAMQPGYGLQTKHRMRNRLDIQVLPYTVTFKHDQTCRHNKKVYIDDLTWLPGDLYTIFRANIK